MAKNYTGTVLKSSIRLFNWKDEYLQHMYISSVGKRRIITPD